MKWSLLPESDVKQFKVYKSLVGVRLSHRPPSDLAGQNLALKLNDGTAQTITFDGTTATVDKINATLSGGRAYQSRASTEHFYIRSNNRAEDGSLELIDSPALSLFGEMPRRVFAKSECFLIGTVDAGSDPSQNFELPDPDGVPQDWYAITTLDHLDYESDKSPFKQAVSYSGDICVLEGCVVDLHGARLADVEVKATLVLYPHSSALSTQVSTEPVFTLTGPDGRFSLILLQGTTVQLEIPAVGFSRNVDVPEKAYVFVSELLAELDYRFPLESF